MFLQSEKSIESLNYTNINDLLCKYDTFPISWYLQSYISDNISLYYEKQFLLKLSIHILINHTNFYDINVELLYNKDDFLSSSEFIDNKSLWFGKDDNLKFLLLSLDIVRLSEQELILDWFLGEDKYSTPFNAVLDNKNIYNPLKNKINQEIIDILNESSSNIFAHILEDINYINFYNN